MQTVCKLYKKVAFAHTGPKEAIFTRLRCKQWSCDHCAAKNAFIWREFLAKKLPEIGMEWYLVTLTANEETRSQKASLENIRGNFDRLLKRVKRVFGRVEYVRTYERHPSSKAIHLHAIFFGLSPYIAIGYSSKLQPMAFGVLKREGRNGVWAVKTWFKIAARACTMGYIVDVAIIEGDIDKVIWYVTKYLTKAQQEFNEKGLRHVQTTRSIGSPKSQGDLQWNTVAYIVAKMFPPNTAITDLNTGQTIDNQYWEGHSFYPYED